MQMDKIKKYKICTSSEEPKARLFMGGYQHGKYKIKLNILVK